MGETDVDGHSVRRAGLGDVDAIASLLAGYAEAGLLLPRSRAELYETLRDFLVAVDGQDRLDACAALHLYGPGMAEVKALAVRRRVWRRGLGRRLVEAQCRDAGALGIERVFCLTYQVDFFSRLGFARVDRSRLPEKVWGECVRCPHFLACDEVAMWRSIRE